MRLRASLFPVLLGLAGGSVTACAGADVKVLEAGEVTFEFNRRSWQHEHGLPQGERVYAMLQSRDGYLWLGTQYGLARFDGRSFTVFDHVTTPELANDDCRTLVEDREGNLWIGTRDGVIRRSGNRFTSFDSQLGPLRGAFPPLCASRSGGVWVGGRGAIGRIQGEAVKVHAQDQGLPIASGVPTALKEDAAGFLWIGTSAGLGRFDLKRQRFEVCGKAGSLERRPVQDLWLALDGALWILLADYIPDGDTPIPTTWVARVDPARWPNAPVTNAQPLPSGWFGRFLAGDAEGTLWVAGGRGGVCRYRNGQVKFLPLLSKASDDASQSVFPDREGNVWVGTDKGGLERWTPRDVFTYTTENGLAHDNAWSICEGRDGRVWVGTDGGVTQFKDGRASTLKRPKGSVHTDVRAVAEDFDGAIWIGTMRSLECMRNGAATPVELPGEWFEAKIRALQPGRDGSMWVGTVRGLTRLQQGRRTKYAQAEGLGSEEVRAILEDRAGDLWVGTLGGGLSQLHSGRFTTLTTTNGLPSNNVWALHEDTEGVIWIGTDNGLSCYVDGRLRTFNKAEGLPETLVNSIVSDNHGRLWIGHDRGIYALEKRQLREIVSRRRTTLDAVSYDESDGLLSVETNGQKSNPSACRTRDGRLWFPTTQGVAVIDPARVRRHQVPPLAAIEEVRANGQPVLWTAPYATLNAGALATTPSAVTQAPFENRHDIERIPAGRSGTQEADLQLRPGGARVLEFDYTANTFVAAEKARFKYRLVGLDEHWIDAGTRRQAYFTDLHPGNYRFEVRACNHHGIWQEKSTSLAFYLAPFYYQTWWFYLVCGAATALVLGLAIAWRARELRRIYELQRIKALDEQRRRIARDIHDELGASLTHILRLSDRARKTVGGAEQPELPAERIAAIAGEAVDNINEIVWANNPEYDTLEDLVAYLREHAASFFADTGTHVHFDFPETIPDCAVTGFFRRHLVLVMKEALQNVAKHAGARSVDVRLTVCDERLELSVTDDGRGFAADGVRSYGNGLTNMRGRVAELEGTLQINSRPGAGTEIKMIIPLADGHTQRLKSRRIGGRSQKGT